MDKTEKYGVSPALSALKAIKQFNELDESVRVKACADFVLESLILLSRIFE